MKTYRASLKQSKMENFLSFLNCLLLATIVMKLGMKVNIHFFVIVTCVGLGCKLSLNVVTKPIDSLRYVSGLIASKPTMCFCNWLNPE